MYVYRFYNCRVVLGMNAHTTRNRLQQHVINQTQVLAIRPDSTSGGYRVFIALFLLPVLLGIQFPRLDLINGRLFYCASKATCLCNLLIVTHIINLRLVVKLMLTPFHTSLFLFCSVCISTVL